MHFFLEKFRPSFFLFLVLTWAFTGSALAEETALSIHHTPRECLPTDQFSLLKATVEPSAEVQTVRLYFRAGQHENLQFVEMKENGGEFYAVLPKPSPTTERVLYFIEAWDNGSRNTQTNGFVAEVVQKGDECKERQADATYYLGDSPGIVVFTDSTPMTFPAGFEPDGIVSIVPPVNIVAPIIVASAGGGGVGTGGAGGGSTGGNDGDDDDKEGGGGGKKTAIAIGAAGAAALGIGLLATNSDSNSGEDVSPPVESPEEPTPEPPAEPVVACFDMPEKAFVGDVNRIDASCSKPRGSLIYDWKLGDRRTRQGRVINVVYREPGAYIVQLTVKRIGGTIPTPADVGVAVGVIVVVPKFAFPAGAGSDLQVGVADLLTPTVSDGVLRFLVGYRVGVGNRGPFPASGVTLVTNLTTAVPFLNLKVSSGSCSVAGGTVQCAVGSLAPAEIFSVDITLEMTASAAGTTVTAAVRASGDQPDPDPGNNQASVQTLLVQPQTSPSSASGQVEAFLTTFLEVDASAGAALGDVQMNGRPLFTLNGPGRYEYRFTGTAGANVLEAYITMPPDVAGRWHFDFSRAEHFEAGSIEVNMGQVLSQDGHSVVFRLDGTPQSRLKFSFRLRP